MREILTTADWALVISLCSAAISLAALAWNIWAKFIFPKPTVRVSFSVNRMFPDRAKVGKFLTLSATNRASSPRCLGPWPLSSHQRLRYAFRALMGRSSYYPPWPRLGGAFLLGRGLINAQFVAHDLRLRVGSLNHAAGGARNPAPPSGQIPIP